MTATTLGLVAGRHQVPVTGYVFESIPDVTDYSAMTAQAASVLPMSGDVTIYVTGLTAAMLAVVTVAAERGLSLTAMHFDRDSGEYLPQSVF